MPSKPAAVHAAALKTATRIAWAQIIATKFFDKLFITMNYALTALDPCLRREPALSFA